MHETTTAASFTGLVDLAAAELGGRPLDTSDEFFAEVGNLLLPGRGVFIEGKFTDRGKWMDGWESRRRRQGGQGGQGGQASCDWCIIELGAPGQVVGLDIDTNHFSGNHPPFASVEGVMAPRGATRAALETLPWRELLAQAPLRPSSQNLFGAIPGPVVSHVRLNIFPDGGVARFRVFGRVALVPTWPPDVTPELFADRDQPTREHVPAALGDLAAVKNGGLALCCSDAFFGPMNNLLLPGRPVNMGGGWETRRNRARDQGQGPDRLHDWIIVQLGTRGTAGVIEVDTSHFKGNYPDRCSIDALDAPGARMTELIGSRSWSPLLGEVKLSADTRHFFNSELRPHPPASHIRLNIFPDGGLSRLRIWGRRDG